MEQMAIYTPGSAITARPLSYDAQADYIRFLEVDSPRTLRTYKTATRQLFSFFASQGITAPQRTDLIAYRSALKASGHKTTTIQLYMTAARLFFRWTDQAGLYDNIAEHIKGYKVDREHKKDYLTSEQVKHILQSIDRSTPAGLRDYCIIALMVTTGLRTIEVSRANLEDIRTQGDNTALYIQGKGRSDKSDYVILPGHIEAVIREYIKATGGRKEAAPLFISTSRNNTGERLTTRSISAICKARMQAAGYDSARLTAHSLRHTAVTLSLLAGKDITEVQQFARHKNIETTMIYNHALDKAKNTCSKAVESAIFD